MPLRVFRQIFPRCIDQQGKPTNLISSETILNGYSGSEIQHYGTKTMPCLYKDSGVKTAMFYVTDGPGPVIFG